MFVHKNGTYTKDDIYFVGITACIHVVRAKDTLYIIMKLYTCTVTETVYINYTNFTLHMTASYTCI